MTTKEILIRDKTKDDAVVITEVTVAALRTIDFKGTAPC